ncbi:hypothetical protein Deba_2626 [Desulfarculus baarsii DSM 2075]|uniref:Uncharacterized protein n=1 Tax=Desulfarculus baarsii (strain ATCC 33931 / DSM 2075 / LMG 7858 / VKM B-1802 / 2st14) TaxID=644282 RepID=E1QK87_DESB2|nr:hypothetical protein [Desulfarculus baarsii]ADK85980.1 hypothetical protein Deba_2626 [Desulfarculus baarsii DSM 2075]
MKRSWIGLAVIFALLMVPSLAAAEEVTVEGSIQGLLCALNKKACPVGAEDVVAAIEQNFVLVDAEGNWYAISNIGQQWLSRLLGKKVKVQGTLSQANRSIKVNQAWQDDNGSWKLIYSPEIVRKVMEQMEWNYPVPLVDVGK